MKKYLVAAFCLLLALNFFLREEIKHPYVQEYIPGQGNIKGTVDIAAFYERDQRFEVGASKDGYAVFKDPHQAYRALLEKYSDGLSLIRDEYQLAPINKHNYQSYANYGCRVTTGSEEERNKAAFVSSFFDIYENSFR
ncbi:MAG: hypothetical protein Q4A72_04545 [Bacillota bacterium]|nr:hypothetical protein [Bacillota bacterium]